MRKLLRDKLAKAGAPEVVEDEVKNQIHAKTKDIEEGIQQEMVSVANVAIEGLDLGGGGGEDEKKDTKGKGRVEEPDKASEVFHVLLHFCAAVWAFWTYCVDGNVNYMDINPFSGGPQEESVECRMVYFTSIMMYKPATLSLWLVIMATSHLSYWRRVKSIPPKQQTNILPGKPDLPDNYISAIIVNVTMLLSFLWFCGAAYFLPLQFVFLPFTLLLMFGVPFFFMTLPIYGIKRLNKRFGIKETAGTSILEMKVMAAAMVVTFVSAIQFVDFYDDMGLWSATISNMVTQLFDELSFTFSFNLGFALSWPTELNFPEQLPLIISSALLSVQYAERAFKWVYRKWRWETWGDGKVGENDVNNKMKEVLEAFYLFPARATASARRRYNECRKVGLYEDEKKKSAMESGHIDTAFVEDFISNNPDIKKLDLSGCYNLGEIMVDVTVLSNAQHADSLTPQYHHREASSELGQPEEVS